MHYNEHDFHRQRRRAPFFLPVALAIAAALSGAVMLLWNHILPPLLHVSRINYWQSLGLLVLCRILFGRFHFGPGFHPHAAEHQRRRQAWREKLLSMTPEERQKFREEWHRRRGRQRGGW